MWAASEGHTSAVRTLIEAGANVRARTDREVARSFRRSPIGGFTAFLFAARAGHLETARVLLEGGADIEDELPDGTGAALLATMNANYELALFLVDQGLDPNQGVLDDEPEIGYTALHAVTWVRKSPYGYNPPGPRNRGTLDSLTFVTEMVARGADVNARMTQEPNTRFRNAYSWIGATPLLMAAKVADAPLVRRLLQLGADPTITTAENTTLLMVAAGVGIASPGEDGGTEGEALECTQAVLELGGDINAVDDNGETALHGAAYRLAPLRRATTPRPRRRDIHRRESRWLDAVAHRERRVPTRNLQGVARRRGAIATHYAGARTTDDARRSRGGCRRTTSLRTCLLTLALTAKAEDKQ